MKGCRGPTTRLEHALPGLVAIGVVAVFAAIIVSGAWFWGSLAFHVFGG